MQVNVQAARQARQLKESKAGAAFSLGRSLPPSSAQPPLASAWPASSWPHRLADQYQEQDDDHGASPVFGGPSSAGRVRPSGSSLNGCENGSNGPINGEDELFSCFYERGSAHSNKLVAAVQYRE